MLVDQLRFSGGSGMRSYVLLREELAPRLIVARDM